MGRARKLFIPNSVVFVTFRTEEGLPFVPTEYINELIWSAFIKAQENYPAEVCCLNFSANHCHLVIRVKDPELVPKFIGYLKQETAHYINRLLGRRRKTIWVEGYDSPTILDPAKVIEQIAYTFLNPVKDNLVSTVDQYPGVSSWSLFKQDTFNRKCRRIARDKVPQLKNPHRPMDECTAVLDFLTDMNKSQGSFTVSPYCWKECFEETKELSDAEVRALILERMEQELGKIRAEHKAKRLPAPRAERLCRQSITRPYMPKTFGIRTICLASTADRRRPFIAWVKALVDEAIEVLRLWRLGELSVPYPIGLFPPCLPRAANLLPGIA